MLQFYTVTIIYDKVLEIRITINVTLLTCFNLDPPEATNDCVVTEESSPGDSSHLVAAEVEVKCTQGNSS